MVLFSWDLMVIRWWFDRIYWDSMGSSGVKPSGKRWHNKRLHNSGKIHHFEWLNQLFLWPFPIAMLNYQRVTFVRICLISSVLSWSNLACHHFTNDNGNKLKAHLPFPNKLTWFLEVDCLPRNGQIDGCFLKEVGGIFRLRTVQLQDFGPAQLFFQLWLQLRAHLLPWKTGQHWDQWHWTERGESSTKLLTHQTLAMGNHGKSQQYSHSNGKIIQFKLVRQRLLADGWKTPLSWFCQPYPQI